MALILELPDATEAVLKACGLIAPDKTIRRMRRGWYRCWLSIALVTGILATFPLAAVSQDEGDRRFDSRSDPDFGDAAFPLREFLRDRHVHTSKIQHFCIVGYQSATGKRGWIHWSEGHQIILWLGVTNPQGAKTAIARSRSVIDLRKDVVPREADLKGSTYLVTRAWVDHLLADCQARGEKYEIRIKDE